MEKQDQKEIVENKVVIYPAMTSEVNGKQIYFLFSLYQVEDIQKELTVYDVPFASPFVEGIAAWRNLAIPVLSLERYLGLPLVESGRGQRFIVLRSALGSRESATEIRSAIRTGREIKMIPIPDTNDTVKSNGWMNHELVKGIFEWNDGFIVVPDTNKMFQGNVRCDN